MRIAIDIDEVLADTLETFLGYHNNRYNTSFKKDQFHTYNWWEIMGISVSDVLESFYDFMKSDYGAKIAPIEGAGEAVKFLSEKHDISLITGRPKDISEETHNWLDKNFGKYFDEVHFADNFINPVDFTKGDLCKQIGATVMIEDIPRYALSCARADVDVLLIDCPWNQELKESDKIKRVFSWKDVVAELKKRKF